MRRVSHLVDKVLHTDHRHDGHQPGRERVVKTSYAFLPQHPREAIQYPGVIKVRHTRLRHQPGLDCVHRDHYSHRPRRCDAPANGTGYDSKSGRLERIRTGREVEELGLVGSSLWEKATART